MSGAATATGGRTCAPGSQPCFKYPNAQYVGARSICGRVKPQCIQVHESKMFCLCGLIVHENLYTCKSHLRKHICIYMSSMIKLRYSLVGAAVAVFSRTHLYIYLYKDYSDTHTHTHTQTHLPKQIDKYIDVYIHAYRHTCIQAHVHTCTHAYAHVQVYACISLL